MGTKRAAGLIETQCEPRYPPFYARMRVHLLQMRELPEHQVEVLLGPREAPLRLQQGRVQEQPDGGERRPPILTPSRNQMIAPALGSHGI